MAAARKKKDLIPTGKTNQLVARLQQNRDHQVTTARDAVKSWRYIDFIDPHFDTPCLSLEWLFGSRGVLAGRLMQLRAKWSQGKSSFMYLLYAMALRTAKAFCWHVETEGAGAPPDFVAAFGMDPGDLIIEEITAFETCTESLDTVVAEIRGGFGGMPSADGKRILKTKFDNPMDAAMEFPIVAGVDSLSSLGLKAGTDQDIKDMTKTAALASHSRKIREYLRDRVSRFKQTQTLVVLTAHETAKIAMGGAPTPRGNDAKSSLAQEAIGIHATYCLDVRAKNYMAKEKGVRLGDIVTLTTTKNKISPRGRQLDMYLVWNEGFDLRHTDAEFLLSHGESPFTKEECYRHSQGITCKPLRDKSFKTEDEFLEALYANTELVAALREKMRIRGFGFDFETKYGVHKELPDETPDPDVVNLVSADAAPAEASDGVAGS